MSAAQSVRLPDVDCARTPQNARCSFKTNAEAFGSVGTGWPFKTGGLGEEVYGGFVSARENALYVPSEVGVQDDRLGGIIKVDLATGNRTLISGQLDATESRGQGATWTNPRGERVTLYDLGRVRAVRPGPSGSLYALVDKGSTARSEILQVDLATGNRRIIWANRLADDAMAESNPASLKALEARTGVKPATLCERVKPISSFETDGQNIYLVTENDGLLRLRPGVSCEWVSRYDRSGQSLLGSGPVFSIQTINSTALIGDWLTVAGGPNTNALFAFNVKTGERKIISRHDRLPAKRIGKNDVYVGYRGAHAGNGKVYATTGFIGFDSFFVTIIDPKTGDRTAVERWTGSLSGWAGGRSSDMQVVSALPGRDEFIVYFNGALHVINPKTANSYVLSQ